MNQRLTRGGLLVLALLPLLFSSCIYRNVRAPGPLNQSTQFNLDTDDFEILGTVESTGTYKTWVWMVTTGGNSYVDLQDKARAMGGDEIINFRFNVTDYSILFFIYNRFRYHATATVIKYKPGVLHQGRFRRQEIRDPDLFPDDADEPYDDDEREDDDNKDSNRAPTKKPDENVIVPKSNPAPKNN